MAEKFSMKLGEIAEQQPNGMFVVREGVANVVNAKHMPIKTQYHLSKIAKALVTELRELNEKRIELVKEYGFEVEVEYEDPKDLDENGKPKKKTRKTDQWRVKPENMEAFGKAFNELVDVDVEIPLRTLKLSDLGEPEGTSPADLLACQAFIIDE